MSQLVPNLNNVVPLPLEDRPGLGQSAIWTHNWTLNAGERVFIQAPSGTGKTTLIHLLYGLRTDFRGTLEWQGGQQSWEQLRRNELSIVFQDLRLFPELTLMENIEVKRVLNSSVSPSQIEEWLKHLDIFHKKNALAATLSYGEKQRAAICRALVQPFSWLLMDEPFSHLDRHNTALAIELIKNRFSELNAGLILADLDENTYFDYNKTFHL